MIPTILPANYIDTLTYSGNWPEFPLHGTVDLIDCIECVAEENEDEGSEWELALTYPQGGYGFDELALDKIILAKVNDHQGLQAFRIYSIEKAIGKTVAVKAQHISYDMINVPVKPFKATSASSAVTALRTNTIFGENWKRHHFYIDTDVTENGEFKSDTPTSMRAMLLDGEDSINGTFGGDLIFDNYHVSLKKVGGADRDVTINYGVDLIDMTQEQNNSEMITGILPYYKRSTNDEQYETNPIIYGDVVYGPGTYTIQKIESTDLTDYFPNNVPTSAEVTTKAREWVAKEEIGIPEISLTVQYATLGQDVRIHDAIRVRFPNMGVDTKAKVVKYKYNVLLERCEEIEVGHAKDSGLFSLMDASKLRKGLMPPARIQNGSISGDKIKNGGIGRGKIGPEAVNGGNLEKYSIDHDRLSGSGGHGSPAVNSENIEEKSVTTSILDDGAVTDEKIGRHVITGDKIKERTVQTINLGLLSVTSDELGGGSVTTSKIVAKAVENAKLAADLQTKIASIDTLAANVATINKIFAGTSIASYMKANRVDAVETFLFQNTTVSWQSQSVYDGTSYHTIRYLGRTTV